METDLVKTRRSAQIANEIHAGLVARGEPERAKQQQAYMKSEMPFAGVTAPEVRKFCRAVYKENPPTDRTEWLTTADLIWRNARFREERHAAIELLAIPRWQKEWLHPDCLSQLHYMIQSGAWWDYVDALAINHVGPLLRDYEEEIKPILRNWITDPDLWVRRSAILAQLKFKTQTDLDFLHDAIQGSISDDNFFARKAIGWVLREYSRTDPDWVISYVKKYKDNLSGLSVREGLRLVKKTSTSPA